MLPVKTLLLILALLPAITCVNGQTPNATKKVDRRGAPNLQPGKPKQGNNVSPELLRLRNEYVQATVDYKESLKKLLAFYEADVVKAEQKLELSRRQLSEGMIPETQVKDNERYLTTAKQKVSETKRQMKSADDQIAGLLAEQEIAQQQQQYKEAVQRRRRERKPRCANWTMTASRHSTAHSVSFSYKFICQD